MKKLLFAFSLVLLSIFSYSQQEWNIWHFGHFVGLDFATDPPTIIPSPIFTAEGSAAISDRNGNLLFFTEGITVWDRNNNVMPNGTGLMGNGSADQSAIIVPKPGTYNASLDRYDIYYIFTVDARDLNEGHHYGVRYTEVDMTLNGGMGDVTANKNILLFGTTTTEMLTSTLHANGCDYWVITNEVGSNTFRSYLVDENGVNMSPVFSTGGPVTDSDCGQLKASSDYSMIAMADCHSGFYLFDFDNSTGILTLKYSDAPSGSGEFYSVEFSPDASKLYANKSYYTGLFQYDATATSQTDFINSRVAIGPSGIKWNLQLAPNGKIYVAHLTQTNLSVINNPNLAGAACNYSNLSVPLASNSSTFLGLPNFPQIFTPKPTDTIHVFDAVTGSDTICHDQVVFELTDTSGILGIEWSYANINSPNINIGTSSLWDPTFNNVDSGTYNVTAIVYYKCWTDTVDTVFSLNPITIQFTPTNAICSTGDIDLSVTGGINPYFFTWSEGSNTEDLTNVVPGNYTVTVQDTYGCSVIGNSTITGNPNVVSPNIIGSDFCSGSTSTLDAGSGFVSYSWSNGLGNSQTVSVSSAGSYTVTVTDSDGCQSSDTITIIEYVSPSPNIIGNDFCPNTSSTLDAGSGYNSYLWSSGLGTSQTATINTGGNYSVTVTDANGCEGIDDITVNQYSNINITTNLTNISCFGYSDGEIDLSVSGGTSPYTFVWDNTTQTSANINNLSANNYSVTVTDINNCTSVLSTYISEPTQLTNNINSSDVSCYGLSNGQASITANGGTPPYSYTWSNGHTTSTITNLDVNTYSITVTDANGCTTNNSALISQPSEILVTYNTNDILCYGDLTGMIDLTVTGGTNPYSYNWSNQTQTEDLINVAAGTYVVTITDSENCTKINSFTISEPNILVASLPSDFSVCNQSDNTILATVEGGTVPYDFIWNTGDNTQIINYSTNISQTYYVTVTDANGCTSSDNVTVSTIEIALDAYTNQDTVCPGDPVLVTTNITGGMPPFTIYDDGQITTFPLIVYPNGQENYTLQVVDACGNTDDAMVNIYTHPIPPLSFTADILQGCPPLKVQFNQNTYNSNFIYSWTFDDINENNLSLEINPYHIFTQSGLYDVSIQVTDSNGCKNQLTIADMIEVYPKPDAMFYIDKDVVSFIDAGIYFDNQSIDNYNNFWMFDDGDSSIIESPYHNYEITGIYYPKLVVENEYGCKDTAINKIEVQDEFTLYVPTAFSPDNDGINDSFKAIGHGIDANNYYIAVYDRWGEKIWESTDLFESWKGTAKNGNEIVQNGTYKWLVVCKDFNGIEHTKSGNVTVIR